MIHHPLQKAIEDVYAAGHTPRLRVDARRRDVELPTHIRERWQERLVIDLDPNYPLALEYSERGVEVDLAFAGTVTRCVLAWAGIYAVIDRETGSAVVLDAHLPRVELPAELSWSKKPRLHSVSPPAETSPSAPSARDRAREAARAAAQALSKRTPEHAPPPSDPSVDAPAPTTAPAAPASDKSEAQSRRARFRVIDGGG